MKYNPLQLEKTKCNEFKVSGQNVGDYEGLFLSV